MKLIKLSICLLGMLVTNAFALDEVIKIAASPVPHAEILKQVEPILKKEGVDLQITEFSDYIQPNLAVAQGSMDANFFQHAPYLKQFNKEHGTTLVALVGVHVEPMGVYVSGNPALKDFVKTKSLASLPKTKLVVGLPNDTTNEGRALLLLQKNGFIKIKSGVAFPTKSAITTNTYNLKFMELDPAMLPRMLLSKQIDLAVINSNYALPANLNPKKDAVFIEDASSPYVNIIAVRPNELNQPKMKKLAQAMHSVAVKQYIEKQYKGAIVPAF